MKNYEKYERAYFMPPEACYDWVKKDYIDHPPVCAVWICEMEIRR